MLRQIALAGAALVLTGAAPAAPAPAPAKPPAVVQDDPLTRTPRIEHISMRLFYVYSGTLSGDIAPPRSFTGWNTVIGEGDAREAADDLLVTVKLKGRQEAGGFGKVNIVATNQKGQVVGKRIAEPYLADIDGNANVGLWLHNIGCAGKLTVKATMGRQVKTSSVNLDCGE